jgi:hypothetical protein
MEAVYAGICAQSYIHTRVGLREKHVHEKPITCVSAITLQQRHLLETATPQGYLPVPRDVGGRQTTARYPVRQLQMP